MRSFFKQNIKIVKIIISVLVSLIVITLSYFLYNKITSEVSQSKSAVSNNIQELQARLVQAEQSIVDLQKKDEDFQYKLWACTTYIRMYQNFYEKADEMFANGISGCAIQYINSGKPNELPVGCYKWESRKLHSPYTSKDWYIQDPDQRYYDSIKALYYEMLKYKSLCGL